MSCTLPHHSLSCIAISLSVVHPKPDKESLREVTISNLGWSVETNLLNPVISSIFFSLLWPSSKCWSLVSLHLPCSTLHSTLTHTLMFFIPDHPSPFLMGNAFPCLFTSQISWFSCQSCPYWLNQKLMVRLQKSLPSTLPIHLSSFGTISHSSHNCWQLFLHLPITYFLGKGCANSARSHQHIGTSLPNMKSQLDLTLFGIRTPSGKYPWL